MATISKPNTFSAGGTIVASEHNDNYDTIYNDYNGNITNANISGSAAIVDTKLAQITTASKVSLSALVTSDNFAPSGNWTATGIWDFTGATLAGASPLVFEGSTANDFETTIAVTDPTADRTITIPDSDVNLGNVVLSTSDAVVKAWGTFNGSGTPAFADSYNMDSSITDNGTGDYTISFTTDFADANYSIVGTAQSTSANVDIVAVKTGTSPAAGSCNIVVMKDTGAVDDSTRICFIAIGGQ